MTIVEAVEIYKNGGFWISTQTPPKTEDPILLAFKDEDGVKYVGIGWYDTTYHAWRDKLAGGPMKPGTKCIAWLELPEPPEI